MGRSGFESVSGLRTKSAGSNGADDRCKLGAKSDKNKRCQRHDISLPVEPSLSSQSSFRSRLRLSSSSAQAPNTNPDSRADETRTSPRCPTSRLELLLTSSSTLVLDNCPWIVVRHSRRYKYSRHIPARDVDYIDNSNRHILSTTWCGHYIHPLGA